MNKTILAIALASISFASTASVFSSSSITADFDGRYVKKVDYNADKLLQKQNDQRQDNTLSRLGQVNIDQDQTLDNHEGRITFLENNKPADGKDGKDGKDGLNGLDGKDGETGAAGHDGLNGADGQSGTNGVDGKDGAKGDAGAQGEQGNAGIQGQAGTNGNAGADGKAGANGKDADMSIVNAAIQRSNKQFSDLSKQVDDNKKKANAGASSAMAAAGIPQVLADQTFAVGAAVGGYEGEQALAVGFSARASQNVVIKAAVAADSQSGFGYNVGTSIGW